MLENYFPKTLDEIVGQPLAHRLRIILHSPSPRCFLLDGEPGIGKSATAMAIATDLGADDDWEGYLRVVPASELSVEECRSIFEQALRIRRSNWKVLVIEELDGVASKQVERYLKVRLDLGAPPSIRLTERTLVIATSNGAERLTPALRERFSVLPYSCGEPFAEACQERLAEIWEAETGEDSPPPGWDVWGWIGERFSMRDALRCLEECLLMQQALAA